jgi:ElaB/YqjD/DUF883 family membrane-anchored ribosome-binding protein
METTQAGKIPSNVQEIPTRETMHMARERFNKAAHYANEQVHGHPWTSVGVGFGAGVLIGALIVLSAVYRRD